MIKKLILVVAYSALITAIPALAFTKPFVMPFIRVEQNDNKPQTFNNGVHCNREACITPSNNNHLIRDDLSSTGAIDLTWEDRNGNLRGPLGFRRPVFGSQDGTWWDGGPARRTIRWFWCHRPGIFFRR